MAATVRGVTSGYAPVGPGQVSAEPDQDTKAGDQLYALHTAVGGSLSEMSAPTPGTWQALRSTSSGEEGLHTKLWRSILTAVPAEVTVGHEFADGTLHLATVAGASTALPQIIVGSEYAGSQVWAPAATPGSASGVELRFAGVFAQNDVTPEWAPPAGYSGVAAAGSGQFATSGVAFKTVTSTTTLPKAKFGVAGPALIDAHTYTIIIASGTGSGGGGSIPTPPVFPPFTPLKGVTRTSYTVHDFLTGELRGDIYPAAGLAYDRRDGEAGGWSGVLPIANRRDADRIAEIIPRDPDDLSSGPGRLVVHSWREGVPCGIHWLHTAEIAKTRLGLGVTLQGTTLDGYMNSVSLEADVAYEGDQLDNARGFITHMGADPRSNPGFALSAGTSGLVRPLIAAQADLTTYGRVLRDYARVEGGFGYVVDPTLTGNSLERRIRFGSPRLELPDELWTFTESREGSGEVTHWREIRSALSGGTRIGVIGGTPDAEDATEDRTAVRSTLIETPYLAAGWPIVDLRVNHPAASTDLTELERYALRYKATAAGAPRVFSANVILGKVSQFNPNGIGAQVEFVLNNDWHVRTSAGGAFAMPPQRLIAWKLTPGGRGFGKDRLEVITAMDTEAAA